MQGLHELVRGRNHRRNSAIAAARGNGVQRIVAPSAIPAVRLVGIVKRFGSVTANNGVELTVYPGEIHALLGENGAGKSTLMNILAGVYMPDAGRIDLFGQPMRFTSPRGAMRAGIGMVHQHFAQVPGCTVAQNIALSALQAPFFIRRAEIDARIEDLNRTYHLRLSPRARVGDLSVGERQRLELLRLLAADAKVLILDEPTAVLTPQESEQLFAILRDLAAHGRTVIFITHKLDEVRAAAHRLTVLRKGQLVAAGLPAPDCDVRHLAALMVGEAPPPASVYVPQDTGEVVFSLEYAVVGNGRGGRALAGVSLRVRAGEICAIAGVAGNGQRELAKTVLGLLPLQSGRKLLAGADATSWPTHRLRAAGVGFVPEDRLTLGVCAGLSVADNLNLPDFGPSAAFFLPTGSLLRRARDLAASTRVVYNDLGQAIRSLSGGNIQRAILAREMAAARRLLIVSQPTRGLDLAAAAEVRAALLALRRRGVAVLLISYDLDEIVELADRVLVLARGCIAAEYQRPLPSHAEIGLAMTGGERAS